MADLVRYGLARVKILLRDSEEHDGGKLNRRPPRVGDIGTITDIKELLFAIATGLLAA